MNLTPLPEPFYITRSNGRLYEVESGADVTGRVIGAYTQDQLRQAQREAVAEIEAALPAMREYARKNPKHHFSTDGTEQDPNGAHAWLERNDKPNAEVTGLGRNRSNDD